MQKNYRVGGHDPGPRFLRLCPLQINNYSTMAHLVSTESFRPVPAVCTLCADAAAFLGQCACGKLHCLVITKFNLLNCNHGRFNALLRVTISLAHVTLNAGYFSPGSCIATSWTVFSTLLVLWPQPHFKRTAKTLPTLRKNYMQDKPSKIVKRKAVSIAYHFPI